MRTIFLTLVAVAIGMISWPLIEAAETKPPRSQPRATDRQSKAAPADESASNRPAASITQDGESEQKTETAVFAGGCFWCTEFSFEQLTGVIQVESGYCGGTKATANYEKVHLGTTGHAEAVRITYDPKQITYEDLLDVFFDMHDPTQLNRQGADDVGRQYRSAIFYANEEQEQEAKAKIAELKFQRVYKRRIVTKLEPLKEFYPAEEYHQNYARKNPQQPYIQSHALPKALHIRNKHPGLIRSGESDR